jgi:hypothetical protein
MAMGITPNWGNHATSYRDLGGFGTPVTGFSRTATVNFTAPSAPGAYYIIAAYHGEYSASSVMSSTNWSVGSPVWDDGDDVADWPAAAIEEAIRNGAFIRDEADRVNRVMTLDSEIGRFALRADEARNNLAAALVNAESVRNLWLRAWDGCGIVPESPSAMLTWLRRRSGIVDQLLRLREVRCELTAISDAETVLAAELSVLLIAHGLLGRGGAADLLATAESLLKGAAECAERRRTALALRQSQAAEVSRTESKMAEALESVSSWRLEWAAALKDAGLESTASPAATLSVPKMVRNATACLILSGPRVCGKARP